MFRFALPTALTRRARQKAARSLAFLLVVGGAVATAPGAHAGPFQLEGRVQEGHVWSGYWWPMLATKGVHLYDTQGTFQPLNKYAQLTGDTRPLEWEKYYKYTTDPSATWWGHCDGWAASSVLEQEPKQTVKVRLKPGYPSVEFNVGDIKGLLAACHSADPADFFSGGRRDQGATYQTDLRALMFHKALLYYIGQRQEGFVMNITPRPNEIWNHPIYAYRMQGQQDPSQPSVTQVTTTIWYADDAVAPDYLGTKLLTKTYSYSLQGTASSPVSAEWTGSSVQDHPHFAWHPAYAQSYDPESQQPNPLRYDVVQRLAQVSAGKVGN
jgi:hypothetical protein